MFRNLIYFRMFCFTIVCIFLNIFFCRGNPVFNVDARLAIRTGNPGTAKHKDFNKLTSDIPKKMIISIAQPIAPPNTSNKTTIRTIDSRFTVNGPSRIVQIDINNACKEIIYGGRYSLNAGYAARTPSYIIKPGSQDTLVFQKGAHVMKGTSGVITFRVGELSNGPGRFALFWSIPYQYLWNYNWLGLKWISDDEIASQELFYTSNNKNHWFPANDEEAGFIYASLNKSITIEKNGFSITANMTDETQSLLVLTIQNMDMKLIRTKVSADQDYILALPSATKTNTSKTVIGSSYVTLSENSLATTTETLNVSNFVNLTERDPNDTTSNFSIATFKNLTEIGINNTSKIPTLPETISSVID